MLVCHKVNKGLDDSKCKFLPYLKLDLAKAQDKKYTDSDAVPALRVLLEPSLLTPHTVQASAIAEKLRKLAKNTTEKAILNPLNCESKHDQN